MLISDPYVVGRYYTVPTVRGKVYSDLYDWPVMGPEHEDAEFINFPHQHYHVDWRFVPERLFNSIGKYGLNTSILGTPLMNGEKSNGRWLHEHGLPDPLMKRLRCKREFPEYPKAPWMKDLEEKYEGCRLKTAICPHRGIALDNLPCNEDGIVTCPAHGLRWNIKTGEMVRTTK